MSKRQKIWLDFPYDHPRRVHNAKVNFNLDFEDGKYYRTRSVDLEPFIKENQRIKEAQESLPSIRKDGSEFRGVIPREIRQMVKVTLARQGIIAGVSVDYEEWRDKLYEEIYRQFPVLKCEVNKRSQIVAGMESKP